MAAFVEANWAPSVSKKGGWEEVEDSKLMLDLMLSSVGRNCTPNNTSTPGNLRTLDLLGAAARNELDMNVDSSPSPPLAAIDALDLEVAPLPPGWQKCLDLQTGRVYYLQNNGSSSSNKPSNVPSTSLTSSHTDVHGGHTPSMNCMETNAKQAIAAMGKRDRRSEEVDGNQACQTSTSISIFGVNLNSPPIPKLRLHGGSARQKYTCENGMTVSDMTTVGCANCLMFVMLSTTDPHCPNCGSSAVLDFSQPVTKKAKLA